MNNAYNIGFINLTDRSQSLKYIILTFQLDGF